MGDNVTADSGAVSNTGSFVNPFKPGVDYDQFLEAVAASGKTVEEYLAGKTLVEDDTKNTNTDHINWIVKELDAYKKHVENRPANEAKHKAEHAELYKQSNKKIN